MFRLFGRFFTICFLINAVCFHAAAQHLPSKPKEISKAQWEKFLEKNKYFTYDSVIVFRRIDTGWACYQKQYFKYNNSHQVTEIYITDNNYDTILGATKEIKTYDSITHRLAGREFYKFEAGFGRVFKDKYAYSYDKDGNMAFETKTTYLNYRGLDPTSWKNMSGDSEVYLFNSDGVPVEKKIYEGIRNEIWSLKMQFLVDSFATDGQPVVMHASTYLKNKKEVHVARFSDIKWYKPLKNISDAQTYASKAVVGVPRSGAWLDSIVEFTYHNPDGNIDSVVDYSVQTNRPSPISKRVFGYGFHCKDTLDYVYVSPGGWKLAKGHKETGSYDAARLNFIVTVTRPADKNAIEGRKENWEITEKRVYY